MKEKKSSPEQSMKYIKIVSYALFFYFGLRLVIFPIAAFQEESVEFFGIFNIILNIVVIIFGLYATYQLRKLKRWALISIIVLFILNIISVFALSMTLGNIKMIEKSLKLKYNQLITLQISNPPTAFLLYKCQ